MSSRRLILKGGATGFRALFLPNIRSVLSGGGLKARVARGGAWVGVASGFDQGSRLVRNMILTRLLAPEAFGLMAIVLAVNTLFESFTEVGIDTAIVQNQRSENRTYLNGAWWLSIGRALALYAAAFAGAPWLADFYRQPSLAVLTRTAFLAMIFRGAISPKTYLAHKRMDFKRLTAINQGAGALAVITTVLLAFVIRDVWALVIGFLVESVVRCIISYAICPFLPGLKFDKQSLRELYKYSRGIFGLPILTFVYLRADIFVIGRLYSATALGIYGMAASLGRMPLSFAGTPLGQLVNPAFSEIQTDRKRSSDILLRITSSVALLAVPAMVYVSLYAKDLLLVAYGRVYAEAAVPMAVLFASAMLGVVSVPVVSLYYMTGRPQLNRLFALVRTVLIIVLIYPATKWYGLTGAAGATLVSMVAALILQVFRLRTIVELNVRQYAQALAKAAPFSSPLAVIWIGTHDRFGFSPLTEVGIGTAACLLCFALALPPLIRLTRGGGASLLRLRTGSVTLGD